MADMHESRLKEGGVAWRTPDAAGNVPPRAGEIYLQYAPLLRKIAMRKFRVPRADAEVLVHDVFVTYLTNPGDVNALEPYLVGAICNASRHYWRRTDAANALADMRRALGRVRKVTAEERKLRLAAKAAPAPAPQQS